MKAVLLALIVVMAVLYGETKHIHPRNHNEDEVIIEKIDKFIPDSISASTIKTFVSTNNLKLFKLKFVKENNTYDVVYVN